MQMIKTEIKNLILIKKYYFITCKSLKDLLVDKLCKIYINSI